MKKIFSSSLSILIVILSHAQGPAVTSWILNTTNATGYNNIPSNCQVVQYSTNNVYVSCTCVPSYSIGPWQSNPNTPSNQNFVYKITRNPVQNLSTPTTIGLGHIGVWTNGVSIFNVQDGMSYNNQGIWNRDALYWEGISFDSCLGHAAPNGEYHNHVNPHCLYNDADSLNHSPIIGYAFDGFPVYGAYAYTNTNGTGPIKRMRSSYVLSTNTTRTNGPVVNSSYPAGCFIEDYNYVVSSGDLDARNGRFCITPEYPSGIYAYFVTINDTLYPTFPYTYFGTYYGVVQAGNTGPGGGHNTISESTTIYSPSGVNEAESKIKFSFYPNPTSDFGYIYFDVASANNIKASIYNINGELIESSKDLQPSIAYALDLRNYAAGIYYLRLTADEETVTQKVVKVE